jgi:hypothetical protein
MNKVDTKISYEKVVESTTTLENSEVVSGQTTDYGLVEEVVLVFKDKQTNKLTQSVTFYHKETNEVEVVSVETVEESLDSTCN